VLEAALEKERRKEGGREGGTDGRKKGVLTLIHWMACSAAQMTCTGMSARKARTANSFTKRFILFMAAPEGEGPREEPPEKA